MEGDPSTAILALEQIFRFGMDIKRFCTDLIGQFRTLLLCKINGCRPLIDLPDEEFNKFSQTAKNYTAETLHLKMNMLIEMVENIGRSNQPRLILETTFLKMIEAGNVVPVSQLLKKLDTILAAERGEASTKAIPAKPTGQEIAPGKRETSPPPPQKKKEHNPAEEIIPLPEEPPEFQQRRPTAPREFQQRTPAAPPTPAKKAPKPAEKPKPATRIKTDWKNFLAYVQEKSSWMAPALSHVTQVEEEGGSLLLHYDDAINCTMVRRPEHSAELKQFILDFYDKNLIIKFILPEEKKSTSSNTQNIRHELMHDPLVIATAEIFRGTVGDIRVTTKK
ncbi:DNA polymerase III subunit gamma/tau [Desulfotalea psychrophila]|uniref:Related to DNA polymerase III, subunit gamma/tau n=1 Tax=Desulfotalea psychrophila (strain LSv54 / DSM 12343) TaxID=177439 RepID=Q6ANB5_DESPS|nr:DNA polymerase III subunit gamma/tau [Desulfotalea psychrophila]CAG36159.1 related to DNA polymerase III, subunit gamma/tau [Desulfotalea psychrophila LSv54]